MKDTSFVQRLMEFVEADLDASSSRRFAMGFYMECVPAYDEAIIQIGREHGVDETELWEKIREFQSEWRKALDWIEERKGRNYQIEFLEREVFSWTFGEKPSFTLGAAESEEGKLDVIIYNLSGWTGKSFGADEKASCPKEEKTFPPGARRLFSALDGLPTFAIGRCGNCGQWFFNPTKREKVYCSPVCRNRANVRKASQRKKKGAEAP